ncbi:probable plastid-lipid-associated protein 12, chloroplastic isoform X5 [Phoenix dactylifera]|uniref:Probable plastid-lipid-associated protein 12, chloroplastic isoform X5 n=1 Tax=Phoenix dactylifera TaxID=42345 RepID=A0A8B8ZZ35_PHODC|nr:probable plastid-lipid-associated protein 12, chloroplastic isoform X5 [Phoenix dactylifera]
MAAGAVTLGLPLPSYRLSTPFPPSAPRPRNLFPKAHRRRPYLRPISSSLLEGEQQLSFTEPEAVLLESLLGIQGRGRAASPQQLQDVERAVQTLESLQGLPEPRTFVGVDFFKIFQEVYLRTDDPRVSNIVKFSDAIGELKVEAAAKIKDRRRILFQFDRAAFCFKFLPFKVPYPVPFRLLGDEAKGWLDTTYLSHNGNIRISRGNKGTTFVLQKETEPRQRLLSAISGGTGVTEVIDELVSLNPEEVADVSVTMEGEWQLLWASQMKNESWSSIAANGLKGLQIVTVDGRLENLVDPFPGFKISANGNLIRISNSNMYIVTMKDGAVSVGTLKFPLDIKSEFRMELLQNFFVQNTKASLLLAYEKESRIINLRSWSATVACAAWDRC